MDSNATQGLRDIKPLVQIPDVTIYIYYGVWIAGILLLAALLYLAVLFLLRLRKENLAKRYLKQLNAIDLDEGKKAVYNATHYGRLLATDERRKELFEQLNSVLERYKYKKQIDPVDEETKRLFELYKQVCNESV